VCQWDTIDQQVRCRFDDAEKGLVDHAVLMGVGVVVGTVRLVAVDCHHRMLLGR